MSAVEFFTYVVETSHNGVEFTPAESFRGRLPYLRAQRWEEEHCEGLFTRITRMGDGRLMQMGYPASFSMGDVIRDLTSD